MLARTSSHWLLLGLDLFMGIVAVVCGVILSAGLAERLLQLSPDVLAGTPFGSFLIPGLLLAAAVGGSYLAAAAGLLRGHAWGVDVSLAAGVIMLGWIVGEVLLLGWVAPRFLQPFIAGYALTTIALALRAGALAASR